MARGRRRSLVVLVALVACAGAGAWADRRGHGRGLWHPWLAAMSTPRTIDDVVASIGPAARARLKPHFTRAGVAYPPTSLTLLAFKHERVLELWAQGEGAARRVRGYAVLAASGGPGPKLREGDLQVPEGRYRVLWLNPNSSYHLSLKLDYPNARDLEQARRDGRTRLGGDIFIHGRAVSIGCLALGDEAIEELFVLAADVGVGRLQVLIAPIDFRVRGLRDEERRPDLAWLEGLYDELRRELRRYPRDAPTAPVQE